MAKLYDLAVKVGSYTDKQGNEKHKWQNIGAVMEGKDGGQYMMIEKWFNPAGISGTGESILVSMFPPKDKPAEPKRVPQNNKFEEFDEDVPF